MTLPSIETNAPVPVPPTAASRVLRRVLMLVPALGEIYGGPSLTAIGLAEALGRAGLAVDVITTAANGRSELDVPLGRWVERNHYRVRYFPRWGHWEYKFSPAMATWLWRHMEDYDLAHGTSVFNFPTLAYATIARALRVPYVINPQGMLEPWAMAYKARKKRFYWRWLEKPRLDGASAIHCLTEPEARNIAALGVTTPLVIVPNGVRAELVGRRGDPERLLARFPECRGKILVLFLHRVDPKKGLDLLAPAFAEVCRRLPGLPLHLVVAGPPTDDFLPVAQGYFAKAGCAEAVTFTGMLLGEDKGAAFAAAKLFVTPTYSEGFSMAVLEAMAAGLPSVLTVGCNFPEAGVAGAAKVVPIDAPAIADAMTELLANEEGAREMGDRARELVRSDYTWDGAARRTYAVYAAIVAGTPLPYCVAA